jgi:RHS repeat-associated protein
VFAISTSDDSRVGAKAALATCLAVVLAMSLLPAPSPSGAAGTPPVLGQLVDGATGVFHATAGGLGAVVERAELTARSLWNNPAGPARPASPPDRPVDPNPATKQPSRLAPSLLGLGAVTGLVLGNASSASAGNPTINHAAVTSPVALGGNAGAVAIPAGTSTTGYVAIPGTGGTGGLLRAAVLATGVVTAVAGGGAGSCVDGATGALSSFGAVKGIVADSTSIYSVGDCSGAVRKTTIASGATSTLATITGANYITMVGSVLYVTAANAVWTVTTTGTPTATQWVTLATGLTAHAITPNVDTAAPAPTTLYVAEDTGTTHQIQKIVLSTGAVTTLPLPSADLGLGGLVGYAGFLYNAAIGGKVVRAYDNANGTWDNIAGSGGAGMVDATGTDAWFAGITGIATDGTNLWLADSTNNKLRKAANGTPLPSAQPSSASANMAIPYGTVATVAGNGTAATVDHATGLSASFKAMGGVVLVGSTAYVGTTGSVRAVGLGAGAPTSTLAGSPTAVGCVDSTTPSAARFGTIASTTTDGYYIYVSDASCGIRRVSIATGATSTVTTSFKGRQVSFGGDNKLYLANNGTVAVLNRINGSASNFATFGGTVSAVTTDATNVYAVTTATGVNRIETLPYTGGTVSVVTSDGVGTAAIASAGAYLYNSSGSAVRRYLKATGVWTYVAGSPQAGYANGAGPSAAFSNVTGIVSDGASKLWATDSGNFRLRTIVAGNPQLAPVSTTVAVNPGQVSTFAGSGTNTNADGTGTGASFGAMGGTAVVGGFAYQVVDGAVRKVATGTGVVTTLAGSLSATGCTDSTDPAAARFGVVAGVAADGYYLYVADISCGLRRVALTTGATSTVNGSIRPTVVTVGPDGVLYTAGANGGGTYGLWGYGTINKVDPLTGAATSFAPSLSSVQAIAADDTYLWATDALSCQVPCKMRLHRITLSDGTVTPMTAADNQPGGGALISAGTHLYGGGYGAAQTQLVRYVKSDGSWTTVAGVGTGGFAEGTGTDAWFSDIRGLASDGAALWLADHGNHRLRKAATAAALPASQETAAGDTLYIWPGQAATFAGSGTNATVDGVGTAASFGTMSGTVALNGDIFVSGEGVIRRVNRSTGAVTTLAGSSASTGCSPSLDPAQARFSDLRGITTDGHYLYVVDYWCDTIWRVSASTGATSIVTGGIDRATGITFGPDGNLYVVGPFFGHVVRVNRVTGVSSAFVVDLDWQAYSVTSDSTYLWATKIWGCYSPCRTQLVRITPADGAVSAITPDTGASLTGPGQLTSAGTYLYAPNYSGAGLVRIVKATGAVLTVAGSDTLGYGDGVGAAAGFANITGAVSDGRSVWVADADNHRLRRVIQGPVGVPSVTDTPTGVNPSQPCSCEETGRLTRYGAYPINVQYGNFYHTFADLSMPGRGMPISLSRTYNSDANFSAVDSAFGYGWSHSYGISLTATASQATIKQEDASRVQFDLQGSVWKPTVPRTIATLTHNGDGTWTFTRRADETLTFNSTGKLTRISDRNGFVTAVTYPTGATQVITDPAGRTLTLTFTGAHVTSAADSSGRSVTYAYDGSGNLIDAVDVGGGHTTFTYDGSHRMLTMRYPRFYGDTTTVPSPVVTNHYDASGRIDWQSDQQGRTSSFDYTSVAGSTKVTDPAGHVTLNTYSVGLLVSLVKGYGTAQAATWRFGYDPDTGAATSVVDPNGRLSTKYLDASGNVTATVDPLGRVGTAQYNAFNQPTSTTDVASVTTTTAYDAAGNITSTSTPLLGADGVTVVGTRTTTYNYGGTTPVYAGDITSIVDPNGKTWTYRYDSYGNLVKTIAPATPENPAGNTTTFAYNAARGWLTSTVSPQGNISGATPSDYTTTLDRDAFGQVTTTKDPLWSASDPTKHRTVRHYDADGNLDSTTNANGKTTAYTYNAAGELTSTGRADATTLTNEYWPDGALKTQKDGSNQPTSFTYDALGRLVTTTDPLGRTTTHGYDSAGNLATVQNQGGNCAAIPKVNCTSRTYDAAGQLTSITYSDGTTPNVSNITYDANGRRSGMTDGTGSSVWAYDSLGRLSTSTNGAGSTLGYVYDLAGHLTQLNYPGGTQTVTRSYDDAGRLASVTDWLSRTTSFAYNPDSALLTTTYPNGTTATSTVDRLNGPLTSTLAGSGGTLSSLTYTRDGAGQLASQSGTGLGQPTESYGYTALEQLKNVNGVGAFNYDAADNLTRLRGATQAFDVANQLTSSTPDGGSATAYTYDTRGNRTSKTPPAGGGAVVGYGWDQANRLISAGPAGSVSTYSYNGDGLRMSKAVAGATTQFAWDMSGGLPLTVRDGSTSIIYGADRLPLAQVASDGTTHWFFHDQLGSTRALTNSAGALAGTWSYDPSGKVIASTGPATTRFGFTGEYTDAETGFLYLRARFYDVATGQFLNRDPLTAITGSPYGYVAGDPLNEVDPLGLRSCSILSTFNPFSKKNCLRTAAEGGSPVSTAIETLDPAYHAIHGYYNEWQAAEHGCSGWTVFKYGAEGVIGTVGTVGLPAGAVAAGGGGSVAGETVTETFDGGAVVEPPPGAEDFGPAGNSPSGPAGRAPNGSGPSSYDPTRTGPGRYPRPGGLRPFF